LTISYPTASRFGGYSDTELDAMLKAKMKAKMSSFLVNIRKVFFEICFALIYVKSIHFFTLIS
jgi:hypothetical protein